MEILRSSWTHVRIHSGRGFARFFPRISSTNMQSPGETNETHKTNCVCKLWWSHTYKYGVTQAINFKMITQRAVKFSETNAHTQYHKRKTTTTTTTRRKDELVSAESTRSPETGVESEWKRDKHRGTWNKTRSEQYLHDIKLCHVQRLYHKFHCSS